jgi:ABC-type spermidine/putrescine transport system permease subunit II
LRSAFNLVEIPFSFWTIILGHATFCVVVVYNSVLVRPRQRPVTNVIAVFVIAVTFVPILVAYYLTRGTETIGGTGK